MQNYSGELADLYMQQKGSASNRSIGVKNHASIQMNVVEADKVTGRFNGQFKTCAICEVIRRCPIRVSSYFVLCESFI
uniref:Uncharacterized protein n=1 Tax=Theropithecus gelada TaxID=9565 RepID=A0A8D2F1N0_THEGE